VEKDDISSDRDSLVGADDHDALDAFDAEREDDLDDDFGRELPDVGLPLGTHPKHDTDTDSTELYQERPDTFLQDDNDDEPDIYDEREEQDYL
jgi:hypothetical protein